MHIHAYNIWLWYIRLNWVTIRSIRLISWPFAGIFQWAKFCDIYLPVRTFAEHTSTISGIYANLCWTCKYHPPKSIRLYLSWFYDCMSNGWHTNSPIPSTTNSWHTIDPCKIVPFNILASIVSNNQDASLPHAPYTVWTNVVNPKQSRS